MLLRLGVLLLQSAAIAGDARVQAPADSLPSISISLEARRLWVIAAAGETLYTARVAVGSGKVLRREGAEWRFETPTGTSTVAEKQVAPLWVPPDWHYYELARRERLDVRKLGASDSVPLRDGKRLVVRGDEVGVLDREERFEPLPPEEEIIFGGTIFIPPFGTKHRKVPGVLGPYRLLLANRVGLHGTNAPESVGRAVTHGCLRLLDADITWLYENVPIGARVVIYR